MRFQVKAMRGVSDVVVLPLEAADEVEAARQAKEQGYHVLSVAQERSGIGLKLPALRRERFPLMLFTQELMSLLDAGLAMVESIETLAEKERATATGKILNGILSQLYEGRTLSYALDGMPEHFPALYVATVRASERTGDLKEALSRYVEYQGEMDKVRRKIVSASIYPVLLIGVGGLVTLFLLLYVVPRFSRVYADVGKDLPFLSRMLMEWGQMLEGSLGETLFMLAVAIGAIVYGVTRPELRQWLIPRLWAMPGVGERMRIYQLARFYRTLGMLLRSGIPIVGALDMAGGLLTQALQASMKQAARAIREGQTISHAMEAHGLSTPVAQRMLRVGERSGRMGQMMERIASFYEEEQARWVDWFTRLFEPILMAVIGIVIGCIVLLLYMPIFELAGSLQ